MKKIPFKPSSILSIGVELEFQIINPLTWELAQRAKDLMRNLQAHHLSKQIKPEITQGMIEINSSIQRSVRDMHDDLFQLRSFLSAQAKNIGVKFCGGGTHPFHQWARMKIYPTQRFKNLSHHYRYLSKRSTVFGQHIHIGCPSGDDALYLTHALSRYVPHLITLSASSPFYQGVDTRYYSTRANVFNAFPSSGVIPYLTTWEDFSNYFYKMRRLKIISTMKDFYWDIRPKPEFGTVEVRVCDTPLTIEKAIIITAYLQTVSRYLLLERPFTITPDLYYLHPYNKFQASRYGFSGKFIDPSTQKSSSIGDDILATLEKIEKHTTQINTMHYLTKIHELVKTNKTDAAHLRAIFASTNSLSDVVREQCRLWET